MHSSEAAKNVLKWVLETISGEKILIFCDKEKAEVGKAFSEGALSLGLWTRLVNLETNDNVRIEVPKRVIEVLSSQKPDLYINLLRGNREETSFRIRLIHFETRDKNSRLGHCPGVTLDMLTEGALSLCKKEHKQMQNFAKTLMKKLSLTKTVEIESEKGTHLTFRTQGRTFFTDTIFNWSTFKWINLPTGEVIIAPVEDSMEGKLVCDMAIGGVGSLNRPVELEVYKGKVEKIHSDELKTMERITKSLETDEWSNMVGEFAFGINPKARFVEEFLESEKILGTIHVAFGRNTDMPGGKNPSENHIDFLISNPTVKISDGEKYITILKNGIFII